MLCKLTPLVLVVPSDMVIRKLENFVSKEESSVAVAGFRLMLTGTTDGGGFGGVTVLEFPPPQPDIVSTVVSISADSISRGSLPTMCLAFR